MGLPPEKFCEEEKIILIKECAVQKKLLII